MHWFNRPKRVPLWQLAAGTKQRAERSPHRRFYIWVFLVLGVLLTVVATASYLSHQDWQLVVNRTTANWTLFSLPGLLPLIVLLTLVVILVPKLQGLASPEITDEKRFERENEARKTLAQILAGGFVLLGLMSPWQSLDLTRQGQITDRYARAIGQLGDDHTSIRLGGLYSLEQIARDSNRNLGVMEVLSAHARASAGEKFVDDRKAVFRIIGRRDETRDDHDQRLDLGGVDFQKFEIQKGEFSNVNLADATLRSTRIFESVFARASLRNCKCEGADFSGSHFTHAADLRRAVLTNARLFDVDFQNADLSGANLEGAGFWGANFTGAKLNAAKINRADFTNTNVTDEQVKSAIGEPKRYNDPSARPTFLRLQGKLQIVSGISKELIDLKTSIVQPRDPIEIYCDGLGDLAKANSKDPRDRVTEATRHLPRTKARPKVWFDGVAVNDEDIEFSGAAPPGYQINLRIPDLPAGRYQFRIGINNRMSDAVLMVVGSRREQ